MKPDETRAKVNPADFDIHTPQDATKAIHDLRTAVKTLAERGDDHSVVVRQEVDRLRAAVQKLSERPVNTAADGAESNLKGYVNRSASGEPTTLRWYNTGHGRKGGDGLGAEHQWGLLDDPNPTCRWQEEAQRLAEQVSLVRMFSKGRHAGQMGNAPKSVKLFNDHLRSAPDFIKQRAFVDQSGEGAELIPDVVLPTLEREIWAERKLVANFRVKPMSAKNEKLPFLSLGGRPYLKGEATDDSPAAYKSSSLTTAQRDLDAIGFAIRYRVDEDASEDAIVNAMDIIRAQIAQDMVDGEEDAFINGDTGTHQDTALATWDPRGRWGTAGSGGSDDHRRAWIGLRARAADVSNAVDWSSNNDAAGYMKALAKLDSPHGTRKDVAYVVSPESYLLELVPDSNFLTVDKYGMNATLLTGEIGRLADRAVIVSDFLDNDLQSTGLYTTAGGGKTAFLVVSLSRFIYGVRKGATIESAKDIKVGMWDVVLTKRGILYTPDSATKKNVFAGINMATS